MGPRRGYWESDPGPGRGYWESNPGPRRGYRKSDPGPGRGYRESNPGPKRGYWERVAEPVSFLMPYIKNIFLLHIAVLYFSTTVHGDPVQCVQYVTESVAGRHACKARGLQYILYSTCVMCIAINLGRKFANYHLSSYQLTTVCCVEKPKSEFPTLNLEKMV